MVISREIKKAMELGDKKDIFKMKLLLDKIESELGDKSSISFQLIAKIRKKYKIDSIENSDSGGIKNINIFNEYFYVPNGCLIDNEDTYFMDFLSTRVFEGDLFFIENLSSNYRNIFLIKKLYPHAPLFVICTSIEDEKNIQLIAQINDFKKIKTSINNNNLLEHTDTILEHIKNESQNPHVIFSTNIKDSYQLYFDVISKLDGSLILSLFIRSTAILPVYILDFFKKNRNISIIINDSSWSLQRHQLGHFVERTHSLDIVVAMYNASDYIIECVNSLICTNRDDINILVVNDGSTDNSAEIVKDYFSDNPNVHLLNKPNGGCASARNYGRLFSKASHITFVDADDFFDDDFFAHLFDLALYTGNEVVQGGFDFFDEEKNPNYTDSYEEDIFKDFNRGKFKGLDFIRLMADDLIDGQPTIWRRVYRRDFLDAKNIFFPENIRAFDDYIFHLFSIYYANDIYMLPDIKCHYRQHASQDIKQGDERHFNEFYMIKMLLKRSVEEGWLDFYRFIPAIINTLNWSLENLNPNLKKIFAQSAVEICFAIEKTYGDHIFDNKLITEIKSPLFHKQYEQEKNHWSNIDHSYIWAFLQSFYEHANNIRMLNLIK